MDPDVQMALIEDTKQLHKIIYDTRQTVQALGYNDINSKTTCRSLRPI